MKLALAILFEIFATTMLVLSEGFTRILPSILSIIGYGLCYYILTYVFRRMHLGVAYAIWSGVGIVAVNIIGVLNFGYSISGGHLLGMWLIVAELLLLIFPQNIKRWKTHDSNNTHEYNMVIYCHSY
ncbi:TPA: multidrug efflux SMR transporter [Citrobacter freundii]|uniref:DMT family transporter n=1 Tax=Citrobacter freundii TaxID=546 RepID=UPI0023B0E142|nr:multidrug efflux SMR transporter [Citrobacter freundii]